MDKMASSLEKEVPHHRPLMMVTNIGSLLGSILLLVSGIALLAGRSWGRLLCLLAALLLLLASTAELVEDVAYAYPAIKRFEAQQGPMPPDAPPFSISGVLLGFMITTGVFGIGYPVLALLIMMSAPVREYYSGGERDEYDRYRDDDYDDRRRSDDYRD